MNNTSLIPTLTIIFALTGAAYFVYDVGIAGMGAFWVYNGLYGISSFVGFVPVIGPILYWLVNVFWLEPLAVEFTGLGINWVTSIAYWLGFITSVVFTAVATFMAIAVLTGTPMKLTKLGPFNLKA